MSEYTCDVFAQYQREQSEEYNHSYAHVCEMCFHFYEDCCMCGRHGKAIKNPDSESCAQYKNLPDVLCDYF